MLLQDISEPLQTWSTAVYCGQAGHDYCGTVSVSIRTIIPEVFFSAPTPTPPPPRHPPPITHLHTSQTDYYDQCQSLWRNTNLWLIKKKKKKKRLVKLWADALNMWLVHHPNAYNFEPDAPLLCSTFCTTGQCVCHWDVLIRVIVSWIFSIVYHYHSISAILV